MYLDQLNLVLKLGDILLGQILLLLVYWFVPLLLCLALVLLFPRRTKSIHRRNEKSVHWLAFVRIVPLQQSNASAAIPVMFSGLTRQLSEPHEVA